jgi:hypothetical protein
MTPLKGKMDPLYWSAAQWCTEETHRLIMITAVQILIIHVAGGTGRLNATKLLLIEVRRLAIIISTVAGCRLRQKVSDPIFKTELEITRDKPLPTVKERRAAMCFNTFTSLTTTLSTTV